MKAIEIFRNEVSQRTAESSGNQAWPSWLMLAQVSHDDKLPITSSGIRIVSSALKTLYIDPNMLISANFLDNINAMLIK